MDGSRRTIAGVTAPAGSPRTASGPARGVGDGESLAVGKLIGQYELIRELGRGGMGVVYAARDTRLGRRVAIKFLLHASEAIAERFLVEARATARCTHENIVIIHEVDTFEDMPYMVLEYLEGMDLSTLLGGTNSGRRLPATRVIELMLPVARALTRAHELGIVHRDLKPENIFVTSAGQVKVLDFGIAKAVGTSDGPAITAGISHASLNMTSGTLVGTLPYMSPEQLGGNAVDHRSDLWTFGVILYEMLAGYHPIEPLSMEQLAVVAASLAEPMPAIKDVVPDLDPGLARLVDRCLKKKKAERVPSAAELVERLEDLLPRKRGRQLGEGESPYPGLTAFQESDADRFFGRGREVARMVARVRELPLTGVVGPSGAGKSSFIRAGVGPALKASGESWEVLTIRPGKQPLAALASISTRVAVRTGPAGMAGIENRDAIAARLRDEPGALGALLRARARETTSNILVFVDQFEELYTLVQDPDERRAFTAALSGAADDPASPLRVVVSMRSDFLDRIAEDRRFTDEVSRGLVFLQPPDREGLRDALVQPLEMSGYRFESPEIVDEMLDALATTAGALPLLQFGAAKLWDARDRGAHVLTTESYRRIGGISGALAIHADEVVSTNLRAASAEKLTKRIFQRLVTPERTRAIVELADLEALTSDPKEVTWVIDQLVAARLLVIQSRGDGGGSTVEIVHESLIERWPTLRRWLDEDNEDAAFLAQLSSAAKQWEAKGRPGGMLWRGEAMEEARRWFNLRPRESLAPRDRAFLDAVFALARRGARLRRTATISAIGVLACIAVGASVMVLKIHSAEQVAVSERETAEKARAAAEANEKTAADALAQMKAEEQRRRAAEATASEEKGRNAAEVAKANAAEAEAEKAREAANAAQQMNREQLVAHAQELEAEAVKLRAATAKAEQALRTAKAAEEAAEAANKKLQDEITALKAKIANAGVATKLR